MIMVSNVGSRRKERSWEIRLKAFELAASVDEDGMSSDLPFVSLPFVRVIVITSSVRYFAKGIDVLSMIRLDGILYYAQERLLLQGLRFDCKQMFVYEG